MVIEKVVRAMDAAKATGVPPRVAEKENLEEVGLTAMVIVLASALVQLAGKTTGVEPVVPVKPVEEKVKMFGVVRDAVT